MANFEDKMRTSKLPQECNMSDYEDVKEKLVRHFSKQPGITSIYQVGSVSAPGISDLDLVLVYDNSARGADFRSYRKFVTNKDRYVLMHSPAVINVFLFENMRSFFVPGRLTWLWGRKIEIKEHPVRKLFELLIASEYVLGLIYHISGIMTTRLIRVRSTICALGAFKYDLEACGLGRENFPDAWRFVDELGKLKYDWFTLEINTGIKRLINILHEYPAILLDTLNFINDMLADYGLEDLGGETGDLRLSLNYNVRKSDNGKLCIRIAKQPIIALLNMLQPSVAISDAIWALTDYNIEIPGRLFSLLSGDLSTSLKPYFEYRKMLINYYTAFSRRSKGYAVLMPAVRAAFNIVNLRWLSLIILKELIDFR